ncbi:histidine--tRNA ligase [Bifidobacterium indicum]|uniref:histidine--tRNA ligase n=1 Tax=Bifidobacterium indicum TaxID=1691 RepID=UPI0026372ED8|nr:histidine--tRNA ligase [uncultured Bifidobacterium sp.]
MAKGASLSGFPEWLPSQRVVEQRAIDTLRRVFELNGYIGIETRAVEQGSSLLKKGETSKEIYLLSRLQDLGQEKDVPVENRLGLHFDLTVPLSRYVVENSGQLTFPFKRWQIQKVWRGERPQEGRFREFVQADVDVVGNGDLPDHYEVEVPLVMLSALEGLRALGLPKPTVHANNRKLSEGFYRGIGLTDIEGVLREIDKLDKIGADDVAKLLVSECGASQDQARACLDLAELTAQNGTQLRERFEALADRVGIDMASDAYSLAMEGLGTLAMIIDEADRIRPGSVIADLKIARGLDYYTGSVYETFLEGAESLGSICSGGRYDNLASQGNRTYPGVGLSIGLSRLLSYLLAQGAQASRVSPATVMVAVWNEEERPVSNHIAQGLRARGIATDVAPTAAKIGKQIRYADHLGIPYVWFPAQEDQEEGDQVKNIVTGDQVPADPVSWTPDSVYARQTVEFKA